MAKYFFIARDSAGKKREGMLDADSSNSVIMNLRKQGLLPIEVRALGDKGFVSITSRRKTAEKGVSLVELSLFSRQLATMLDAGIPILDSVHDLADQTMNKNFAFVLRKVRDGIKEGNSFSQALARFPRCFSTLYVALVRSGEESGNLVEVMKELSEELEDQLALIRKVRQAMSYPLVILVFFMGVVVFVFFFLIPKFQSVFESFGAQLPFFTKLVLKISQTGLKMAPVTIVLLIIVSIFFSWYQKTPTGRKQIDTFKLKVPVFGELMLKIALARFARSLATLIKGGVGITSALEIVEKASGNVPLEEAVAKVRKGVLKGQLLGEEMKRHKLFPQMLGRMVTVGEDTGRTDDMLNRMSRYFRDEVDVTLNTMASILEPIMIIGLGFVVGIVVMAIYMPIFKLAATMR